MKRTGSLLFLLALVLSLSSGVSYGADTYVYATTNMTWAEFYAGETGEASADLYSAGLDAISTPTTHGLARFPLVLGESGDNGTTITGLKGVQVRMTQTLYNSLSDKSRYTVSDSAFDEYKDVNSDGSFGKMVTESTDASGATVSLKTGSSARWGHYVFSVSGVSIDIGSARNYCDYYLGALLETSDGKIYGMRQDNNIWSNTDIAFTVNAKYTEPHGFGTKRYYEYTHDLAGKTVTKLTYMIKDSPDVVISGLNIKLKKMTDAAIIPEKTYSLSSDDTAVTLIFSNIPDGVTYTLSSVTKGSGRGATTLTSGTDYTYDSSKNVLTIIGGLSASTYVATFTTDEYADLSATIEAGNFYYATTDMTWAEFYAAEVGEPFSEDLYAAGLDAISSPTARVANRFSQLTSESNDIGGRSITGVADVQVRMTEAVYNTLSNDSRYTFSSNTFSEYKPVNANGTFGAMVTELHSLNGAEVSLTTPATWGDYLLDIESIDVTLGSGDTRYYLGALVQTSDGKVYGMRHNNNLWFNAKDLAITTAEFVEVHGVSRNYKYTSDMEGKTITKITYMLKDLPDEIVSCDVFLKYKTSASVSPKYETGWHGVMTEGSSVDVELVFSGVPSSADYKISGVTFGTGRGRKALSGYSMSGDVLTFTAAQEGIYTATFSDETYANISATINVFTVNATDKIISADNNKGGLNFLLTPAGMIDSVDADMAANKLVPASDYTSPDANFTAIFDGGTNEIKGTGFSFDVTLNGVSPDYRGIVGFGKMVYLTPENCGNMYQTIYSRLNAMPTGPSGYREVASVTALKPIGISAIAVQPDGKLRDVSEFTGAGVMILSESNIMVYYGTMMADCVSSDLKEGEHMLSPEGENLIADGRKDGHITGVMYLELTQARSDDVTPKSDDVTPKSEDVKPTPTSDDSRGGGGTPTDTTYVTPGKIAFTLTESIKSNIRTLLSKLSSKITASTAVGELPASAIKGSQNISNPDANTVYLPIIEVSEDMIYVFGVSLDKFSVGDPIYWHSNAQVSATGEFMSAADDEEAAIFMNDSGVEVNNVPSNKHVNVAVYLEAGKTYYPTITNKADSQTDVTGEYGVKSAGGGCTAGMMIPVMLLTAAFTLKRRK